jgi:antitoxin YefM
MAETLPLANVKARFSELVDRIANEHERIVVTRNGQPAAVLISPEDLEGLEETLAILSDREELAAIQDGLAAAARGDVVTLDEIDAKHRRR